MTKYDDLLDGPTVPLVCTGIGAVEPKQCQWCGERFERTTDKAVHVHEQHPETIGRGRTRSQGWTCGCGTPNASSTATCSGCSQDHWSLR